jgi:ribosomal protein S1
VVDVTVDAVGDKEVAVRLADGRPGVVARADFDAAGHEPSDVGSVIRGAVLAREDPRDRVVLSASWARKADAWTAVEASRAGGGDLRGTVAAEVKGGLVVDVGVRAFMPRSLVGEVEGGPAALVGTEVAVAVVEADRARDRLVVSRREVQRRGRRDAEKEAWAGLAEGQRRTGRVVSVEDYGAKVALGPLQGLVHRSELSWGRIGHPSEVVAVGDEVEVLVLEVRRTKRRIGLSMRRVAPHPLDGVEVGSVHAGTVTTVVDYGCFVRLDGIGAEGLVHVSEISELPGARADQLVVPGEELTVKVLSVDRERNRLALSVTQALYGDQP